jgi:endoglucanase
VISTTLYKPNVCSPLVKTEIIMRCLSILSLLSYQTSLAHANCNSPSPLPGGLSLRGVNLSGFDWATDSNGSHSANVSSPTQGNGSYNGKDQLAHFYDDDGFNAFRFPVGWQYLINSDNASSVLDEKNFKDYDALISSCLGLGSDVKCVIDVHNYARFQGKIIGQGGPSNEIFAKLWANIALRYREQPNVIFDLMNEPHDIDMPSWVITVQQAVTAIRDKVGNAHIILLPGTAWMSAAAYINGGESTQLLQIKNPDNSTKNLVFNIHGYFDPGYAGLSPVCTSDQTGFWSALACWLRQNNRLAMITETGGGNNQACYDMISSNLNFLAQNSDVYLGFTAWSAGEFNCSVAPYCLTPHQDFETNVWTDQGMVMTLMQIPVLRSVDPAIDALNRMVRGEKKAYRKANFAKLSAGISRRLLAATFLLLTLISFLTASL